MGFGFTELNQKGGLGKGWDCNSKNDLEFGSNWRHMKQASLSLSLLQFKEMH